MLVCRPFFKRIILHWHAAGLAKWLEMVLQMRSRSVTYRLMKQVDLSIVLSKYNRADAEKIFFPPDHGRQQMASPIRVPSLNAKSCAAAGARFVARRKLFVRPNPPG